MSSVKELSAELFGAPDIRKLSAEEEHELERSQKAIDRLLSEEGLAKYKLEVLFSSKHTSRDATPGIVTWWESGTKLHGGGDAKLYKCDTCNGSQKGCGGFIPDSANGLQHVVCPHCQTLWDPQHLVGEVFFRLPLQKWAFVLRREFQLLDSRADIYLKYGRLSVRDAQTKEQEKNLRGELLEKARGIRHRGMAIYPLKNIIKDTSHGADLEGRILAFLHG